MAENDDVIARLVDYGPGDGLAEVVANRADIMELTQKTHDGALTPAEPGGLSHAERAAIACRIAKLNRDKAFEEHFETLLKKSGAPETTARIADLGFDGGDDPRLSAIIRHADLVAATPKDATRRDVELLQAAGVSDADIVRLSELVAFVSYQIRVAAGLRLLREVA